MKKNLTEIVFILDRSGSMAGLEKDTIGGFNAMIEKQKKEAGEAYVSTILFNHESEVLHDRIPLNEIRPVTEADYFVCGSTALLDALGGAIRHIRNIHKYARPEDVPEHTLFVITTDGMENASRSYSAPEIRKLISTLSEEKGWQFLFLGANIDAVETAATYGIKESNAVDYCSDSKGTGVCYESVCAAVSSVRGSRQLGSEWKKRINEDFEKRGRKK